MENQVIFFKTQAAAFEHSQQNNDMVVCGIQNANRTYKYTSFSNQETYADFILSPHQDSKFVNEMLRGHTNTYLDIDTKCSLAELGFESTKEFVSVFSKFLQDVFKRYFDIKVKKKELLWSNSSRAGKTSFHCVVALSSWYWHMDDRKELKNFMTAVANETLWKRGFYFFEETNGTYVQNSVIDMQVYSKNRLFRSLGCRKHCSDVCLKPVKGKVTQKNIIDHMVSVYDTEERQRLRYKPTCRIKPSPVDRHIVDKIARENDSTVHEIKGALITCRNLGKKRCCVLTGKVHESNHIFLVNKHDGLHLFCHGCKGNSKLVWEREYVTKYGMYESYKKLLTSHQADPGSTELAEVHRYMKESIVFVDDPSGCYYIVKRESPVKGFHNKLKSHAFLRCQNLFHRNSDIKLRQNGESICFSNELAHLCKTRGLPCYNKCEWIPFCKLAKDRPSIDSHTFNLFSGFVLANHACDWQSVKWENTNTFQLLYRNLCNENSELFSYLTHSLAAKLQRPWVKIPIAHCWVAQKQGVGKSSLLVLLARIFATNSQENICLSHNNLATFCGRFNAELSTNLWVALEELKADRKKFDSFLKDFVSNSHILLEKKGQDRLFVPNYSTCLLFSNDLNVTRVDSLDRRQVFYECSDVCRNDADFFTKLYEEFDDPKIMKAVFMFLLSLDLSKWDYRVFPETQTRRKLQNLSKNINHRFAEFILQTDLRDKETIVVDKCELFMLWQSFIEDEGVTLCSKRDRNYVCNSFEICMDVALVDNSYRLEKAHVLGKLNEFKISC